LDPLTQGVVGAAITQTLPQKKQLAKAALIGALGGMAPDLDVLIRSSHDPLLALEYHRHFTHAFAFIPVGGLLVALALHPLFAKAWGLRLKQIYLWATMGYATHALLDVCTSYGTQVFWPFSNIRLSIDSISVIDPLFTVPLLLAVLACSIWRSKIALTLGLVWAGLYLSVGVFQHHRAMQAGEMIAQQRGHQVERLHAKPSFANVLVWKTIYESGGYYYVDAVRLGFSSIGSNDLQAMVWEGDSVAKLELNCDFPWLDQHSQQAKDVERFRWFSDGFLAVDQDDPSKIVDMRYSLVPNEIDALWGIRLERGVSADQHVQYETSHRDTQSSVDRLWTMIKGEHSD
jgi:inner membrane protein